MSAPRESRLYWAHRLHATVLNSIGAAILQSQVCERAVRSALPSSVDELARLRRMLVVLEGQTRALAASATPPRMGPLRVEVAQAAQAVRRQGFPVRVRVRGRVGTVSPPVARGAAVILAEALANAARHGRPAAIEVEVTVRQAVLLVRVRDNGAGCEIRRLEEISASGRRCGVAIMRAQAAELGGRLAFSSAPGRGTQVTLFVPLPAPTGGARGKALGRRSAP